MAGEINIPILTTRHEVVLRIESPHIRAILRYLSMPTDAQIKELEETMAKQIKTLMREFREGIEALKSGQVAQEAAQQATNARIAELEALIADLQSRKSLTEEQAAELEAMVEELAQATGNPVTIEPGEEESTGETGTGETPPGPPAVDDGNQGGPTSTPESPGESNEENTGSNP